MGILQKKYEKYTYSDYLKWDDGERWEIIEGIPFNMSPAPNRKHQTIVGNIHGFFYNFLKGKKCKVYVSPFDVRLTDKKIVVDELIDTVVQPDIAVFCDPSKLDDKGAIGAPDLIVEVLSESTSNKDLNIKLLLYQKFKVQEYWIVDPIKYSVSVYLLDSYGRYELSKEYVTKGIVHSTVLKKIKIDFKDIFAE